jgi:hypothetical protein
LRRRYNSLPLWIAARFRLILPVLLQSAAESIDALNVRLHHLRGPIVEGEPVQKDVSGFAAPGAAAVSGTGIHIPANRHASCRLQAKCHVGDEAIVLTSPRGGSFRRGVVRCEFARRTSARDHM